MTTNLTGNVTFIMVTSHGDLHVVDGFIEGDTYKVLNSSGQWVAGNLNTPGVVIPRDPGIEAQKPRATLTPSEQKRYDYVGTGATL